MHMCTHRQTHTHAQSYVDSYEKSMSALKSNLTTAQQKECFSGIILSRGCGGSGERVSVFVCLYCACVCVCVRDQAEGFIQDFISRQ